MMLDFFSKSVKAIGDSAVIFAASTSIGKNQVIKPKLKEKIAMGRTAIHDAQKELNKIKSIKKIPALDKALNDLAKQGNHLIADILTDKNLDPIVDIIGDHINEYSSIEAFQNTVLEKPALIEMKNFALGLIDIENYQGLVTLMTKLQDFKNLSNIEQRQLFERLQDGQLVERIINENQTLDVNTVKAKTKIMCTSLCHELNLTKTETQTLINLFDSLTHKYLPEVNKIRQSLVDNFPAFIQAEEARILKAHPEWAAQKTTSEKSALTTQYTDTAKPKATPSKAKEKADEVEVVVKKEKTVEKKRPVPQTPKDTTKKAQPIVIVLDEEDEADIAVVQETKKTKKKIGQRR